MCTMMLSGCNSDSTSPTEPTPITQDYTVSIVRLKEPIYAMYPSNEYAYLVVTRPDNLVGTTQDFEWQTPRMSSRLRVSFIKNSKTLYAPIPMKCTEESGNILVSVWNVGPPNQGGGSDTSIIWSRNYSFGAIECFPTVN